ncbi:ABC transporter ATP-binding protein [Lactobacillus ultunensis]|uniref:ABC transporter, ATP-binding protein n=1 Tax=Lactobacillus ultunensis DSM 16047 TaxID=525365 RepID=C2EPT9_9LACO|nr:ABC transporter ATP-binding protein [Lactobacillus ultunensis]EEJ71455.1 ABC transporter, ATP-binding protein [Lactobacillus ultunensis DSM 16047]KRL80084.1 glycerol-3-phosphate-transporting ATPase [Lactobacillus ultunensis DSM 16047]QQP28248.1 ABC transporter ATP-binding protein [Lactobacillus ultunensis]
MNDDKFVEVKNLKKVYDNGHEAIKDVSFSVKKGDLVCLLGPSGCGKTTILNMLAGLLNPTSGDILFDGKSVVNVAPKDRQIGYVFQNYALYPHMTVLQNVMFPLTVGKQKMPKDKAKAIAEKYMETTQIMELADQKPGNLSGGQQQRVAIARALVQEPKILLMDEPLSNLDARLRLKIREEIRTLVKKVGITTLFVTHDQEEALSIGDKIILFNNGVIQQDDLGQNFYLEPNNYFVANFVGNPVIDNFKVTVHGDKITGSDFEINVNDLDKSRFKRDLTDGEYTLSVRPENILPAETGHVSAKVDDVELIGRERILKFTHDGVQARSLVNLETPIKAGDGINLKMRLDRVFLFDKEGERVY